MSLPSYVLNPCTLEEARRILAAQHAERLERQARELERSDRWSVAVDLWPAAGSGRLVSSGGAS